MDPFMGSFYWIAFAGWALAYGITGSWAQVYNLGISGLDSALVKIFIELLISAMFFDRARKAWQAYCHFRESIPAAERGSSLHRRAAGVLSMAISLLIATLVVGVGLWRPLLFLCAH